MIEGRRSSGPGHGTSIGGTTIGFATRGVPRSLVRIQSSSFLKTIRGRRCFGQKGTLVSSVLIRPLPHNYIDAEEMGRVKAMARLASPVGEEWEAAIRTSSVQFDGMPEAWGSRANYPVVGEVLLSAPNQRMASVGCPIMLTAR